jgi:hypothetical protein
MIRTVPRERVSIRVQLCKGLRRRGLATVPERVSGHIVFAHQLVPPGGIKLGKGRSCVGEF